LDLEGRNTKLKGNNYQVELEWNPMVTQTQFSPEPIDIYENGNLIATIQDCGNCFDYQSKYTIAVSGRNLAPRTYKICLSGTNKCSNNVVVNFN
jgi:hypothetical protein